MPKDCISFKDTGYFSELINDYLLEKQSLKPFYNRFPDIDNFKPQIEEKQKSFALENRRVLTAVLEEQYENLKASKQTERNIEALSDVNTFTITTGHQLNLFTGPLYFLYKIISTINLTKELKLKYPKYNFVPVYWMATEDHDFEEINYFNFNGKKIRWNRKSSGAVGELNTEGLEAVFELFSKELGIGKNADELRALFKTSYLEHNNLADATRYLANELFKDYGLVIIDANNRELKQLFIPFIKKEIEKNISFKQVEKTNKAIEEVSEHYKIQVNPREINLFYIKGGIRERIVFEHGNFKVVNTKLKWNENAFSREIDIHPQYFSPNVILRPLYQEVVLPNLCYIGGGGELAYWLQLKQNFIANKVPFPILLLRNSVLIKTKQQAEKLDKLNISNKDIFLKRDAFINKKVRQISNIDIDFSKQINHLKEQFKELYALAKQTDKSFTGAVGAQEKKQINGLEHLEKRLLTAQKRKLKDQVERMTDLQNELFPNQSLQERQLNFSQLYLEFGSQLIPLLIKELRPLEGEFSILTLH